MRTLSLSMVAAAVVTLSACSTTGNSNYQQYAESQANIAIAKATAETARYQALQSIAQSGDTTARVAAVIALQSGAPQSSSSPDLQRPVDDNTALRWASLLVPSLTQFYSIGRSADIAIVNSNNNLEGKKADNSMITDLVQGRVAPVIGTSDDVLLYPR